MRQLETAAATAAHAAATTIDDARTWTLSAALAEFDTACKKAVGLYRRGRPGRADYTVTRAALRVARLVDAEAAEVLEELRLVEPFRPVQADFEREAKRRVRLAGGAS